LEADLIPIKKPQVYSFKAKREKLDVRTEDMVTHPAELTEAKGVCLQCLDLQVYPKALHGFGGILLYYRDM
jgi:hypothetical protein